MKKLIFILFAFNIFAQVDDTPVMQYWVGGSLDVIFSGQSNASGPLFGSNVFGGVISPSVNTGAASVFSNPAELAFLNSSNLNMDLRFPFKPSYLGITTEDIIPQKELEDYTDNFLFDDKKFIFRENAFRSDTRMNNLDIGQTGGIGAFSVAIPFANKLVLGLGFAFPIQMDFGFRLNGFSTYLKTEKQVGNNITPIDIVFNGSVLADFNFDMSTIAFSAGYEFYDNDFWKFTAGLTLNRFEADHEISLLYSGDGMMIINNTTEYFFNDENDPVIDKSKGESNNLYTRAEGRFKSTEWGFRFGTFMKFKDFPDWNFSIVYNFLPIWKLTDENAYVEGYQPKFLTGRPLGENENAFDIVIDSLDIAKPHLTEPTYNDFGKEVIVKIPSSLTLGIDFNKWGHTLSTNFIFYSKEISYEFSKYKIGKELNFGFSGGVNISLPDKYEGWWWLTLPLRIIALDFDGMLFQIFQEQTGYQSPHFRVGGGLGFGNSIVNGIADKEHADQLTNAFSFPIVVGFAIERNYILLENFDVNVLVWGFPEIFLRTSIGYRL